MSSIKDKVAFGLECLLKRTLLPKKQCPECMSDDLNRIDSKLYVAELVECRNCGILFRFPIDTLKNKTFFYDSLYEEGFTTELPSDQKLGNLIESNFSNHEKDFSEIIKILKALGVDSGARILDFGCSWGYGTYQLRKAGYNAEGLEISQRRAEFGRKKFNLEISDSLENVRPGFDVFFSSHVLEHVPSLTETIELAMSKIRPGGIFVAFTPNGSLDYRQKSFADFHSQWGKVHPRCLTDNFYKRIFKENIMLIASNPFDVVQIQKWDKSSLRVMDLSGSGLLAVAIAKE